MSPGVPLQCAADRQGARLLVHVTPLQAQRFALAQADRERGGEAHTVSPRGCDRENPLRLLDGEGFDLLLQPRWLLYRNGIPDDLTAPYRLVQGCTQGAVGVVDRSCLEALSAHRGVELLDVLRLKAIRTVSSEAGD